MEQAPEAEPCPLRLYTYRYWNPSHRQYSTLDCTAVSQEAAMRSAIRYLRRINTRWRRIGIPWRLQYPPHVAFLKPEGPPETAP